MFFIIIFLAEIIAAGWIVTKIRSADELVCGFNKRITGLRPVLKNEIIKIKEIITLLHSKLSCFTAASSDRREKCKNLFKNKYLTDIAVLLMKIPYKKIIAFINIILTIKKIIRV